jgi:carbonic anhydrase
MKKPPEAKQLGFTLGRNLSNLKGVDLLNAVIKENVLVQLDNLRTYPKIAALMAKGALTLHGWIYEIESGQILAYDPQVSRFVPIGLAGEYGAHGLPSSSATRDQS